MSELLVIADDDGDELLAEIGPGIVSLSVDPPGVVLTGQKLDLLREALDRCAMPGQGAAVPHIVTDQASHRRNGCPTCRVLAATED